MYLLKKFGIVMMLILSWGYGVSAATYHMRADGTAIDKAAATGPTTDITKCMSVATHNNQTFSDGDIIYLSDKGGSYTSQIIPPSSGNNIGITYIKADGESPLIDAGRRLSNDINQWVGPDANGVWYIDAVDYPTMIYEDGLPIIRASDPTCSDGRWCYYFDIDKVHYWRVWYKPLTGTPADHILSYDRSGIALRGQFDITGKSYITVDGLTFQNGEQAVYNNNSLINCTHITIKNCTFNYCDTPLWLSPGGTASMNYITVANNVAYRCRSGFKGYVYSPSASLSHWECYGNQSIDTGTIDGINLWIPGIWSDNEGLGFQNISSSNFYNNTFVGGFQNPFILYGAGGGTIADNKFYNNFVYNVTCRAISLIGDGAYSFNNNRIYNNIIVNSGKNGAINGDFCFFIRQGPNASSMNYIENNTIYGYGDTILFYIGSPAGSGSNQYYAIRNNIFYNNGNIYSFVVEGTTNNLLIDYNCWQYDNQYFILDSKKSLTQLRNIGFETHGIIADPQFLNPGGNKPGDYRINTGSPCINAGIITNLTKDYRGNDWRPTPSMGAIEYY